jgi:hypothetical protein
LEFVKSELSRPCARSPPSSGGVGVVRWLLNVARG